MPNLAGIPIIVSELIPEFVPTLKMHECGCSDHVLSDFNAWLLERFGRRHHFVRIGPSIVMNPRTLHAIQQKIDSNGGAK